MYVYQDTFLFNWDVELVYIDIWAGDKDLIVK